MQQGTLHFFGQLTGHRPDWPENMTRHEEQVMGEHFHYLMDLADKKKVLLAGPVFNPTFGMLVLQTESEEEAAAIMRNDPSVRAGLMTFKLQPMRASVQAELRQSRRYVERPTDRILHKEVTVRAALDDVWRAWTLPEEAKAFWGCDVLIELRLGGPYEIYFHSDAPYGIRGTEDCHILSFLPQSMLSFEWNAPPEFPEERKKRTQVILRFDEIAPGQVRVSLDHLGWGTSDGWDKVYNYFDKAWSSVFENLRSHFEKPD